MEIKLTEMIIEKAKLEDLTEIIELQKLAFLEEAHIYNHYHLPLQKNRLPNYQGNRF
jgi:hypothetical protein